MTCQPPNRVWVCPTQEDFVLGSGEIAARQLSYEDLKPDSCSAGRASPVCGIQLLAVFGLCRETSPVMEICLLEFRVRGTVQVVMLSILYVSGALGIDEAQEPVVEGEHAVGIMGLGCQDLCLRLHSTAVRR